MNALLLCQDPDESAVLSLALQRAGLTVRVTPTMEQFSRAWADHSVDLVLFAAVKTPMLEQVRQVRSQAAVPIVVVADSVGEIEQIELLDAGADLLVMRPYSARLLIAQMKSLLRRSAGTRFFSLPTLTQGQVTLDPAARTVTVGDGQVQRLTQLEFRLLYTLMMNPGQVIPTETLVEHVWGYSGDGDRNLVRGLVKRLRMKVEPVPGEPQYVLTEPGIGYRFRAFEN